MHRAALSHPRWHALYARFTWTATLLAVGVGDSPVSDANRVRIRSQTGYRGCEETPILCARPPTVCGLAHKLGIRGDGIAGCGNGNVPSCEDRLTNRVSETRGGAVRACPTPIV